ncbi:DUF4203 domain-containing protein [Cryptosporangium minutisporangium]|uniref:DUF4203 domain-containing protein n=1 Tax=Cryptosporangium minutisporangium TaxID=113569 RepID=A0ABP6T3C3_9ACTN
MDSAGLVVLALGLLLCFAGVRSINLAILACGFAVGWLLTEPFDASVWTALIIALAAAIGVWVVAHLVFRVALFFVGGLAGAVIGAKLFGLLQPSGGSVVLAVLFVAASGFIGGILTQRFRQSALAVACALGGAGLVLSGLARIDPDVFGFLRAPDATWEVTLATALWLGLALLGWVVQRQQLRGRRARVLAD